MTEESQKKHLEIWGDIVDISDLTKAIIISTIITMGAYFLAPADNISIQLFSGLGGALIGFFISAYLIKPKRVIIEKENTLEFDKEVH